MYLCGNHTNSQTMPTLKIIPAQSTLGHSSALISAPLIRPYHPIVPSIMIDNPWTPKVCQKFQISTSYILQSTKKLSIIIFAISDRLDTANGHQIILPGFGGLTKSTICFASENLAYNVNNRPISYEDKAMSMIFP